MKSHTLFKIDNDFGYELRDCVQLNITVQQMKEWLLLTHQSTYFNKKSQHEVLHKIKYQANMEHCDACTPITKSALKCADCHDIISELRDKDFAHQSVHVGNCN